MAIGIFDSGVGGLTVLKEIKKELPNEKIYYFGDTLRVPYGEKSKDFIMEYSKKIVEFLIKKNVDTIVIACNTITAVALDELKKIYKLPIIGVIKGGVKGALNVTENNKIGIIATQATVNSKKYEQELRKENKDVEIFVKACPLLAPAAEEGIVKGKFVEFMIKSYIDEIINNIDTLVLGCTHYPLFKEVIINNYKNLKIVDPAIETAKEVKLIMGKENLIKNDKNLDEMEECFITSNVEQFKNVGEIILGRKMETPMLIEL